MRAMHMNECQPGPDGRADGITCLLDIHAAGSDEQSRSHAAVRREAIQVICCVIFGELGAF
jgi:hypothetical protein